VQAVERGPAEERADCGGAAGVVRADGVGIAGDDRAGRAPVTLPRLLVWQVVRQVGAAKPSICTRNNYEAGADTS